MVCIKNLFTVFFFRQRYCCEQSINSYVMSNHKITAEKVVGIIDDGNFGENSFVKELSDDNMIARKIDSSQFKNNLVTKHLVETNDKTVSTKMSGSVKNQLKIISIHYDKNIVFSQPCSHHVSHMIHIKKLKNFLVVYSVFSIEFVNCNHSKTLNLYEQSKRDSKV